LIKARAVGSKDASSDTQQQDDPAVDIEESWTFIGDESDPELQRRIRDWDPAAYRESRASMELTRPKAVDAVKASPIGRRSFQL
jgi:hypothetical protein